MAQPTNIFQTDEYVLAYHGPLLYEARILLAEHWTTNNTLLGSVGPHYFIHYKGWKQTWDEWVPEQRLLKINEHSFTLRRRLLEAQTKKSRSSNVSSPANGKGKDREPSAKEKAAASAKEKREEREKDKSRDKDRDDVDGGGASNGSGRRGEPSSATTPSGGAGIGRKRARDGAIDNVSVDATVQDKEGAGLGAEDGAGDDEGNVNKQPRRKSKAAPLDDETRRQLQEEKDKKAGEEKAGRADRAARRAAREKQEAEEAEAAAEADAAEKGEAEDGSETNGDEVQGGQSGGNGTQAIGQSST